MLEEVQDLQQDPDAGPCRRLSLGACTCLAEACTLQTFCRLTLAVLELASVSVSSTRSVLIRCELRLLSVKPWGQVFALALRMLQPSGQCSVPGKCSVRLTTCFRKLQVPSYIQICGIILGMITIGYLGDRIGRKWGSVTTVSIMGVCCVSSQCFVT